MSFSVAWRQLLAQIRELLKISEHLWGSFVQLNLPYFLVEASGCPGLVEPPVLLSLFKRMLKIGVEHLAVLLMDLICAIVMAHI